jgi:hypothetical protein
MLNSIRRLISYPNPATRADPADVALYVKNLVDALELDVMFSQGLLADRPISTVGVPGVSGRIYVATDQTPHQMFWDYGTGWDSMGTPGAGTITYAMLAAALKPSGTAIPGDESLRALGTTANTAAAGLHAAQHLPGGADALVLTNAGLYAARPTAAAAYNGMYYYATDQAALYLCVAAAWIRVTTQAGDIIWTAESAARTGHIICTGQAWPATTGIYADLFAKWGGLYPTNLPDIQARTFVAKGTHADMATIGFNDGFAVGLRRMLHKHSRVFTQPTLTRTTNVALAADPTHTHPSVLAADASNLKGGSASGNIGQAGSTGAAATGLSIGTQPTFSAASGDVTVGPQTGNEPTDTEPYIVLQPQVKL